MVVFLSSMLLLGDYLIKYAVGKSNYIFFLILAGVSWCLSIYGWYYLLKENRLSIVGMLFSVISIIGTVIISITFFNEKLTYLEWIGFGLAIISALLLSGKI